ncbi:hypothetical protein H4R26_005184, partial [Coemansia thaxteri]
LSAEEQAYLSDFSSERLVDLYRIWTVKEAYVKAIGVGIAAVDLSQINVELPLPGCSALVRVGKEPVQLDFTTGSLDHGKYVYAIAQSRGTASALNVVDFDEIIAWAADGLEEADSLQK